MSEEPKTPDFSKIVRQSNYMKNLKVTNHLEHPCLGHVKRVADKTNENLFYLREKIFNFKQEALELLNRLLIRFDFPNQSYCNIVDYEFYDIETFCSNTTYLKYLIKLPKFDLLTDFRKRIKSRSPFDNEQLTYLLYDLVESIGNLHEHNIAHQKLTPAWVFLDEQDMTHFRVLDDPFMGVLPLKQIKADIVQEYPSPEEFERQLKEIYVVKYNKFKSDIFQIGLVVLQAGLLEPISGIYNVNNECVDEQVLEQLIHKFESYYGDNVLVCSTIRRFLKMNPDHRPSLYEVKTKLPLYTVVQDHFRQEKLKNQDLRRPINSGIQVARRLSVCGGGRSKSPNKSSLLGSQREMRAKKEDLKPFKKNIDEGRVEVESVLPVTENRLPKGNVYTHSSGMNLDDGVPEGWEKIGENLYRSPTMMVYQRIMENEVIIDPKTHEKTQRKLIKFRPVDDQSLQPKPQTKDLQNQILYGQGGGGGASQHQQWDNGSMKQQSGGEPVSFQSNELEKQGKLLQKERKLVDSKFPHVDMFLNYTAPGLDDSDYLSNPSGKQMWDRGQDAGKSRVKQNGPLGRGMEQENNQQERGRNDQNHGLERGRNEQNYQQERGRNEQNDGLERGRNEQNYQQERGRNEQNYQQERGRNEQNYQQERGRNQQNSSSRNEVREYSSSRREVRNNREEHDGQQRENRQHNGNQGGPQNRDNWENQENQETQIQERKYQEKRSGYQGNNPDSQRHQEDDLNLSVGQENPVVKVNKRPPRPEQSAGQNRNQGGYQNEEFSSFSNNQNNVGGRQNDLREYQERETVKQTKNINAYTPDQSSQSFIQASNNDFNVSSDPSQSQLMAKRQYDPKANPQRGILKNNQVTNQRTEQSYSRTTKRQGMDNSHMMKDFEIFSDGDYSDEEGYSDEYLTD